MLCNPFIFFSIFFFIVWIINLFVDKFINLFITHFIIYFYLIHLLYKYCLATDRHNAQCDSLWLSLSLPIITTAAPLILNNMRVISTNATLNNHISLNATRNHSRRQQQSVPCIRVRSPSNTESKCAQRETRISRKNDYFRT